MSLDADGNYFADVTATGIEFPPKVSSGHGAPDNANGQDGDFYFDLDSNITYIKEGGVWNIVSGSVTVSGGGGTLTGAAGPEGIVTADPGVIFWNSTSKTLWEKDSGNGNTGWLQLI